MCGEKLKYPRQNLIGNKYGKLIVINFSGFKNIGKNRRVATWLCACNCGNKKIISQVALKNGQKSCGCLMKEVYKNLSKMKTQFNTKDFGTASKNHLFGNYKDRAKRKNINFELTKEQFLNLTSKNCYYCGIEPKQIMNKPKYNGNYIYNGIDKLDNNIGYTLQNCVTCCGICNKAKRDLTLEEFKNWIKRLICHQSNS